MPRRVAPDVPLFGHAQEPPADVREAIVRHHRIRRFRAGYGKHEAYPNRGKGMTAFPFVQANPADFRNFLVVDVDREDAELWLMHPAVPEPHWIIQNPETGHAQAGWMIDPVHTGEGANEHPIRYADAVQASLDRLVGADPAFTRFLIRNPAADTPAGDVRFGSRLEPYTLGELRHHMQSYSDPFEEDFTAWDPGVTLPSGGHAPREATEGGRNNAVFYATRRELWRRLDEGITPNDSAAYEFAALLNQALAVPLPDREVRELSASAVRQVLRGKGRHTGAPDCSGMLAQLGRRGGQSRSEAKTAAAAENAAKATQARQAAKGLAAEAAHRLRQLGHSLAEIAHHIGKSIRTVQRYLAEGLQRENHNRVITEATGSDAGDAEPPSGPPSTRLRAVSWGAQLLSPHGQRCARSVQRPGRRADDGADPP